MLVRTLFCNVPSSGFLGVTLAESHHAKRLDLQIIVGRIKLVPSLAQFPAEVHHSAQETINSFQLQTKNATLV
jgi:hypothetical protein